MAILSRENSGPVTRSKLEKREPSKGHIYGLVKRHPELKIKKSRIMESDRTKYVTPTTIGNFFDKLEELNEVGKYSSTMIANFDETMIQCTAQRLVVVGHADAEALYSTQPTEMPHITLGVCVFADGSHAPYLVIYPLKKLPSEVTTELLETYPDMSFAGQSSGWITAEILKNYLSKQVIPHFQKQRLKPGSSTRGLLLVDGHASRINPEIWQLFQDNDIDVMTFVSHASHVLQPLDLCVFSSFKSSLRRGMTALKSMTLSAKRDAVMRRALGALYQALSPVNVKVGFKKGGIWPINRDVALSHPAINNDPSTPPVPIRKRRSVIALDGDVLTSRELIERMTENIKVEKQPRRQKGPVRKSSKPKRYSTPYDESGSEYEEPASEEE